MTAGWFASLCNGRKHGSLMAAPNDILREWRGKLARLTRSAPLSRLQLLQAKVLRYLIALYSDAKCWNRFAGKIPPQPGNHPPAAPRFNIPPGAGRPPRDHQRMRSALVWIRQINAASYHHCGLPQFADKL